MKALSNQNKPKEDIRVGNVINNKKANLLIMEEQILKYFNMIQRNCNAHLQEKFKSHIDYLYSLQKEMKVSYIIIKKLDIREEFLRSNKLPEYPK